MKHEPITIATGSPTRLMIGGREAAITSRKSMAMLVYIALQPDQVESRERLAARLWSDSGPDNARASLRQTLHRLIHDLGPAGDLVEADRSAIRLTRPVSLESEGRAEAILRDLAVTAPTFAPAMVALAQILHARPIVFPGRRRLKEHLEESLALTSRAVNLDPLDSRTHLCRAWSHAIAGTHAAALSHLDLALDLNENDPWTIISAALGFAFAGETERAADLVAQARAFGMRYSRAAQGYIATAAYLIGDHAGAVAAADVAGDAIINLPAWQAASLVHLGDLPAAGRAMTRFLDLALPAWTGAPHPTAADAIDWFMACFPIRSEEVGHDLRRSLGAALEASRSLA